MGLFDDYADIILQRALEARGYVVRHKSEARKSLDWNRIAPFPPGLDFKSEAVEKIKEVITKDIIDFQVTPAIEPAFDGDLGRPEIHRATLRIL